VIAHRFDPATPYSLDRTAGAFARFPHERVDLYDASAFTRAYDTPNGVVVLRVTQPHIEDSDSSVHVCQLCSTGDPDVDIALDVVRRQLAFDEPVEQVDSLVRTDAGLPELADALRGLRRTIDPTPFEGLVSSILAQLISIAGASVVRGRFVERFGTSLELPDGVTCWTFPAPDALEGATLDDVASLGMTGTKARAILAVADASQRGELDLEQLATEPDEAIVKHLVAMPGIGRWTAEWFLVNVMGRMCSVPAGDLGIRRSTGNWLLGGRMPSEREVRDLYEPFGPYRGYLAYYILSAERFKLSPPS
jgi:DNA-3-methyladenine glycosylase II